MQSVLIVAEDKTISQEIDSAFSPEHLLDSAPDTASALKLLKIKRYDIVFIDLSLLLTAKTGNDLYEGIKSFKNIYPTLEIVVMSSKEMIRQAVSAVKAGASDYLTYPISADEIRHVIDSISRSIIQRSELDYLRDRFWRAESLDIVKTRNSAMNQVYNKIRSVAPTRSTVLLTGETGTGKGVMARLIHQHSNRQACQFISVHCGAIPETLLESELFGHEKGAFTGAVRRKLGKFEVAKGGTIFLDEVGTVTPSAQIKLLQVLQDGAYNRVGGEEVLKTDARVIAATNSDLKKMTEEDQFRKDLYYRLNVFPIAIPPLRERIEDLPFLINTILNRLSNEFQKDIRGVNPYVIEALERYAWPGNIRELENLLERAYILETSHILTFESFPAELFEGVTPPATFPLHTSGSLAFARQKAIEEFERHYLKELISKNKGKINTSSEEAGISTRQLHKLLSKYGIRKEQYRG